MFHHSLNLMNRLHIWEFLHLPSASKMRKDEAIKTSRWWHINALNFQKCNELIWPWDVWKYEPVVLAMVLLQVPEPTLSQTLSDMHERAAHTLRWCWPCVRGAHSRHHLDRLYQPWGHMRNWLIFILFFLKEWHWAQTVTTFMSLINRLLPFCDVFQPYDLLSPDLCLVKSAPRCDPWLEMWSGTCRTHRTSFFAHIHAFHMHTSHSRAQAAPHAAA